MLTYPTYPRHWRYSLRDIRSESSMCWNSAELPTALERHSCSVTSMMAKYSILLGGSISSTFDDTMSPYRQAAITVVPMDMAQVTVRPRNKTTGHSNNSSTMCDNPHSLNIPYVTASPMRRLSRMSTSMVISIGWMSNWNAIMPYVCRMLRQSGKLSRMPANGSRCTVSRS